MNGEEMRSLRKKHGLTQKQLAEILGVTQGHVGQMERELTRITETTEAKLSDWSGDVPPLDELPEPPYSPGEGPPPDEDEEPKATRDARRSSSAPTVRKLTPIQKEAAEMLTLAIQGQLIQVPNQETPVVIPGLAHGVASFWCPICANVVATAAPAFSTAMVRAYPGLAYMLARPEGAKAELVLVTVTQIAVPCVMHHVHTGGHQSPNGDGSGVADEN